MNESRGPYLGEVSPDAIIAGTMIPTAVIFGTMIPSTILSGTMVTSSTHDTYQGAYSATPTQETQIFNTEDLLMLNNFTVNPIPQNYGLITYNGFEITVS